MKKDSEALKKELEQEAPFLARLKDQEVVPSAPEGYFRQLQEEVMGKVTARPAVRPLWLRFAAAASIVVLAGVAIFLFRPAPASQDTALTAEEMHQYISQNIDEFDLDLLLPFAAASVNRGGWMEDAGFDDPAMQEYMNELLDEIDLETLEELL